MEGVNRNVKEGENEWQEIRRKETKRKKNEDILNMLFMRNSRGIEPLRVEKGKISMIEHPLELSQQQGKKNAEPLV